MWSEDKINIRNQVSPQTDMGQILEVTHFMIQSLDYNIKVDDFFVQKEIRSIQKFMEIYNMKEAYMVF